MKNHLTNIRALEDSSDREVTGRLPMPGNVFRRSSILGLREDRLYAQAQTITKIERCRWGAVISQRVNPEIDASTVTTNEVALLAAGQWTSPYWK